MSQQIKIGAKGEAFARTFLENSGYEILECNWRYKHLEADIIAKEQNVLVIVEVKTRKNNYFSEPEDHVNTKKQDNLIEIANAYIELNNLENEVRFDIISILLDGREDPINHIKNAFSPTS